MPFIVVALDVSSRLSPEMFVIVLNPENTDALFSFAFILSAPSAEMIRFEPTIYAFIAPVSFTSAFHDAFSEPVGVYSFTKEIVYIESL